MSDDVERFEAWVEDIVRAGRFWIVVGPTGENTVLEDPEQDRDLQLLYPTEADAQKAADLPADAGKDLRPDSIETDDLPGLCEAAEGRGEAFALWMAGADPASEAESWLIAEADLLREELERYAE